MTTPIPPTIELEKGPVDDALMKRILLQWYQTSRSRLMKALEWTVTSFFTAASVFFIATGQNTYAWVSVIGLIVCAFLLYGYVPWLAQAALKVSKKSPSYNTIKHYRFSPEKFCFWYGTEKPVEGPLRLFDEARLTKDALLFIGGGRLALWLARRELEPAQLAMLLDFLREAGVRVSGAPKGKRG